MSLVATIDELVDALLAMRTALGTEHERAARLRVRAALGRLAREWL